MFSGFDSNKKREKSRKDPAIGIAGGEKPAPPAPGAAASGQDPRELGGVTIQEFSKSQKIAEPEAWRMLRRGEIVGRTHEGRLYVFTNVQETSSEHLHQDQLSDTINELLADDPLADLADAPSDSSVHTTENLTAKTLAQKPQETVESGFESSALPPLPGATESTLDQEPPRAGGFGSAFLPVASDRIGSTEIALLLDHLSLAKEENREILKMTQESIRKVTELTDTIVEMKDSLLDARETQILFLKDQLDGREKEIRKLKQQKEDLEILAQTIMSTQQPEKPRR